MYDYYITVARWTPEFNKEEPLRTIMTWVRLPKLPIHFFNTTAVTLRPKVQELGTLGFTSRHKLDSCQTIAVPPEAVAEPTPEEDPKSPTQEEKDIGSWMTVTRRQRKKPSKLQPSPLPPQGSRFTILQHELEPGSKEEVIEKSSPNQPANSGHEAGIESLVDITAKVFSGSKKSQAPHPKLPLGDITNSLPKAGQGVRGSNGKTKGDREVDISLVQVPVVYDDTTFDDSRDS
ncbi:hypothetical protein LINPERHAP1_LOCUS14099 [Linum perenne]